MPRTGYLATWQIAPWVAIREAVACAVALLLLGTVACLAMRHLAGAIRPPQAIPIIVLGVASAAGLAALSRGVFGSRYGRLAPQVIRPRQVAVAMLPGLALVVFGWVWTATAALGPAWAAWFFILFEEAASQWYLFGPKHAEGWRHRLPSELTTALPGGALPGGALPGEALPGETTLQQLIRTRAANGSETILGTVRVEFAPGQQSADTHLAFCPPLREVPALSCEQTEGESVTIRVAERQVYGARLETRLARPARQTASIVLQVHAVADFSSPARSEPSHGEP